MRKFLITGTSKGIGKELAEHFLHAGDLVLGVSRSDGLEARNYQHYNLDFSKTANVSKLAKALSKEHQDINVVIINAGFGVFKEFEQFSDAQILEQFNVNFLSQILLLKEILPNLKKQKNSKIIFVGSEAALQGAKKATIYSASKFAMRGFVQSLRAECASSEVAVSIINPGMVDTSFYDELNFTMGDDKSNAINVAEIKNIIELICSASNNMVLDEINLSPMKKVIKHKS